MGYIPKSLLLKAYETLSSLTEDHKQGQTQIVSAIRHLVAFDMYYKVYQRDCDLAVANNRDIFVENVRQVVNIEGDYYTTNFYTTLKPLYDCGVGSNFYSAGVVKNSRENTRLAYDYPTRGQYPLFKVKNYELIRSVPYYGNLSKYLFNDTLKSAFIIWLLRRKSIKDLTFSTVQQALQVFLTTEMVSKMLPKEERWNSYVNGIELELNRIKLCVDDIMRIYQNVKIMNTGSITPSYRPYITAIKSKPFLLLAGISGTGKSRIVRELARACWEVGSKEYEEPRPKNFEMVQVKPNWHDSSELIGYVSRVSGEPVFVAGDFLKFVAKAWENPEVPYFLCLDEMNLAPVEQYFAEYLSVVESRKADAEGNITTDPILKKSKEDWHRVLTGELTDDDDVRNRFLEDGICLPPNLIVIGTVNMDETTFSFSRKVLDRAMTIEMNEVDLKGGLDSRHDMIGKLGKEELIGTAVEGVDVYSGFKDVCDTAITYLQKVNAKLEGTPFKIAYRTRNEVLLYVVNNLPYDKADNGRELTQEFVVVRALDEITCMKILSRVEGDESKVSKDFLKGLRETIKEGLEEVFQDLFDEEDKKGYKSVSLAKLDEMIKRLDSGYTSFWS